MAKEQEGGIRKETGKWAIAGGIVAGVIGLLGSSQLFVAGLALMAGGYYLKKD